MKIACDLDGVIYDWDSVCRWMLTNYQSVRFEGPTEHWNWIQEQCEIQGFPRAWKWLWDKGLELGLFRHGNVINGAIKAVIELKKARHRLSIVTSRPEAAIRDTHAWVDFHFGFERPYPWSEVRVLSKGSKTVFDAELLIDDKPENIEDWLGVGRPALLFDQPWNKDYIPAGAIRVFSWEHAVRVIERRYG